MEYYISFGDKKMPASEYQCKIFDWVEHGSGNAIINASAGAAKTTTMVNAVNLIPKEKNVLFIAFNRDICKAISEKIQQENVVVSTFHSMGYKILRENGIKGTNNDVNEFKYRNYIKTNINTLSKFGETKSLKNQKNKYINNITDLVEYCRYYIFSTKKQAKSLCEKYGIGIIRDEIDVALKVLKWGTDYTDEIDYTDMIWLPNALNLQTYSFRFDWIMVDESQDTSVAEMCIVEKCTKRGTRMVYTGDKNQQINVWCGADENSIETIKKKSKITEFELPVSYRCAKSIIDFIHRNDRTGKFNIIANESSDNGSVNFDVSIYSPSSSKDMVLCRNTSPLVDLHLKYLQVNKKSYIRGYENIINRYNELIDSSNSRLIDKSCLTSNGLFPYMWNRLIDQIENLKKMFKIDTEDAISHPEIMKIYDDIQGIKVLSVGLTNTTELKKKISEVFGNDDTNAIQLTTVHKSKGLESDNVYILYPSLMPSKMAKLNWEIETELNLQYVAFTRAKKTLNFMAEENRSNKFNGLFDKAKMLADIEYYSRELKRNLELGLVECTNDKDVIDKPLISLGEKKESHNSTEFPLKKKKAKAGQKLMKLLQ